MSYLPPVIAALTTGDQDVLTVPAGETYVLSALHLANVSAAGDPVDVYASVVDPNGTVGELAFGAEVAAGDALAPQLGMIGLTAGWRVRASASADGAASLVLSVLREPA